MTMECNVDLDSASHVKGAGSDIRGQVAIGLNDGEWVDVGYRQFDFGSYDQLINEAGSLLVSFGIQTETGTITTPQHDDCSSWTLRRHVDEAAS